MDAPVQSFAVANLRRRPEVVEVGGFVAGFDPDTTSPFVNYATPLPGAEPTAADVAALVGAFRARERGPRLEFAPDAAPAVRPALDAAGFVTEEAHAYLVCTPVTFVAVEGGAETAAQDGSAARHRHSGHAVRTPRTDADYEAVDAALSEAFDGAFEASPDGSARLRRTQERGGAVRFVRAPDGTCAGAGSSSPPAVGTSELAGVGTRPAFRGRGVAASVTSALTEAMFAHGAESVWLEYSGEDSRRLYERLGYRPRGTRLYMVLES